MIRALTLAVLGMVLGLALNVGPAHAEPEVPAPAEAGTYDAGWMRVVCSGTVADQRCHLRVPAGFTHMHTTYTHGGDAVATEDTMPYSYRPHLTGKRFDERITTGVRVACRVGARSRVVCKVSIAEHVDRFAITTWSAGDNYGTTIWTRE